MDRMILHSDINACYASIELLRHPEIETVMFPYNIVENQGEALFAQAKLQNVASS